MDGDDGPVGLPVQEVPAPPLPGPGRAAAGGGGGGAGGGGSADPPEGQPGAPQDREGGARPAVSAAQQGQGGEKGVVVLTTPALVCLGQRLEDGVSWDGCGGPVE